jgi:poly(hydroxyalkanoate) granule-associated protein
MAGKQNKGGKANTGSASAEYARRVWLAGLGVLSLTHKHGSELLESFIIEGKDLQSRTLRFVRESATDAQAQATGIFIPITARIEKQTTQVVTSLENGVARVCKRLGIPTKSEIDALSAQVAALNRKLKTAK